MRWFRPWKRRFSSTPFRAVCPSRHFEIKGDRSFTEHYSVIGPEVEKGPKGETLGEHNDKFINMLKDVDRLVIAGQAKSHCVAWTISDLLSDLRQEDPALANKIYLLEDCTSPVVVPGADYTEQAGGSLCPV